MQSPVRSPVGSAIRSPMQKIALFLPSLRGGGAERVMVLLANGFVAAGHEVDLVTASDENVYQAEIAPGIRHFSLGASRVASSLPALVRYLKRERPAALLSAMGHANVVAVAARALARLDCRLVVTEHTNYFAVTARNTGFNARVMRRLMRHAYLRADAVVAVSQGVADDLARGLALAPSRIEVIFNPIVDKRLVQLAESSVEDIGEVGIVAVGRLIEQKGFDVLIDALARLRQRHEHREVRLTILGEGPLRDTLLDQAHRLGVADAVSLPGFVDNPFVYMRKARVFALSSYAEGLPSVLIQAMACGTPVVATDCPSGPQEILEGGRWGRLIPMGDSEALADALEEVLSRDEHPPVHQRAADFGAELAVERYLVRLNSGVSSMASLG